MGMRSVEDRNKVTNADTSRHEAALTWQEADPPRLGSLGLKAPGELDDLRAVEHGHLQTWVLLGQLVGQGARAACGKQKRMLACRIRAPCWVSKGQLWQSQNHAPRTWPEACALK